MKERLDNVLKIIVEDEPNKWKISSGPTSVEVAKKILARQLETGKCTLKEIDYILPKFEKELAKAQAIYHTVEIEVLIDKTYIDIKLRDPAGTIELNVPLERSSL